MAPDVLTRMASSHSGQRVGSTESGSVVKARTSPEVVRMLQASAAAVFDAPKNAPAYAVEASNAGPALLPPLTEPPHSPAAVATVATAVVFITRLNRVSGLPVGSPNAENTDCAVAAHARVEDENTAVSLSDGQRLSQRGNSVTGWPSKSVTKLSGGNSSTDPASPTDTCSA